MCSVRLQGSDASNLRQRLRMPCRSDGVTEDDVLQTTQPPFSTVINCSLIKSAPAPLGFCHFLHVLVQLALLFQILELVLQLHFLNFTLFSEVQLLALLRTLLINLFKFLKLAYILLTNFISIHKHFLFSQQCFNLHTSIFISNLFCLS